MNINQSIWVVIFSPVWLSLSGRAAMLWLLTCAQRYELPTGERPRSSLLLSLIPSGCPHLSLHHPLIYTILASFSPFVISIALSFFPLQVWPLSSFSSPVPPTMAWIVSAPSSLPLFFNPQSSPLAPLTEISVSQIKDGGKEKSQKEWKHSALFPSVSKKAQKEGKGRGGAETLAVTQGSLPSSIQHSSFIQMTHLCLLGSDQYNNLQTYLTDGIFGTSG